MSPEEVAELVLYNGGDVLDLQEALKLAGHHWSLTWVIALSSKVLRKKRHDGDTEGHAEADPVP
jgi:hypothetical protein